MLSSYLTNVASYFSAWLILDSFTISYDDVLIMVMPLISFMQISLNTLYFSILYLRRTIICFYGHQFSVDIWIWRNYMHPFSAQLSFVYCLFFLEHTTLNFTLLWCNFFDNYFYLSCSITSLPLLLVFIDLLVTFFCLSFLILTSHQCRVDVFL